MRLDIKHTALCANEGSELYYPLKKRTDVLKTFKAVRSKIYDIPDDTGELQTAAEEIDKRIK